MDTIVHTSSYQFTLEHCIKTCYAIIAREEYEARAFRMERPFFMGRRGYAVQTKETMQTSRMCETH